MLNICILQVSLHEIFGGTELSWWRAIVTDWFIFLFIRTIHLRSRWNSVVTSECCTTPVKWPTVSMDSLTRTRTRCSRTSSVFFITGLDTSVATRYHTPVWTVYRGLWSDATISQLIRYTVYRSFRVTVARAWNSLPTSITALTSLPSFKRQLKTFLFIKSFPSV